MINANILEKALKTELPPKVGHLSSLLGAVQNGYFLIKRAST